MQSSLFCTAQTPKQTGWMDGWFLDVDVYPAATMRIAATYRVSVCALLRPRGGSADGIHCKPLVTVAAADEDGGLGRCTRTVSK